uniref:RING-type E3 ubiquitin transferase n=1 Tax=Kalanchoe fedtschenkoi TaxID=63787 RepID=A0A7N0VA57_KALFE
MDKYSTTPVGKETVVAIAVTKGRTSQAALTWTVENLLVEGHSLLLVNVRQPADFFQFDSRGRHNAFIEAHSGIETQKGVQEGYKDILRTRAQEMLLPFQSYCKQKNIKSDIVLLEDNDLVGAIADFVLTNNVDVLVMGAGSQNGLLKKFKGPSVATRVLKKAPYFCTVYVIAKGRLLSVRPASSTNQTLSDNDNDILEHEKSIHEATLCGQLTHTGSSVSSRTDLLRPGLAKEFGFRSPLQNYSHSNFSIGGFSESESDISFVSSDREFHDSSSSGYSTNSSNWDLGSFEGPSFASSNCSNWRVGSFASSRSDSVDYSMDELLRLRLELIKTKNMCDSVCSDGSDAKMLTSDMNSSNLEQGDGR